MWNPQYAQPPPMQYPPPGAPPGGSGAGSGGPGAGVPPPGFSGGGGGGAGGGSYPAPPAPPGAPSNGYGGAPASNGYPPGAPAFAGLPHNFSNMTVGDPQQHQYQQHQHQQQQQQPYYQPPPSAAPPPFQPPPPFSGNAGPMQPPPFGGPTQPLMRHPSSATGGSSVPTTPSLTSPTSSSFPGSFPQPGFPPSAPPPHSSSNSYGGSAPAPPPGGSYAPPPSSSAFPPPSSYPPPGGAPPPPSHNQYSQPPPNGLPPSFHPPPSSHPSQPPSFNNPPPLSSAPPPFSPPTSHFQPPPLSSNPPPFQPPPFGGPGAPPPLSRPPGTVPHPAPGMQPPLQPTQPGMQPFMPGGPPPLPGLQPMGGVGMQSPPGAPPMPGPPGAPGFPPAPGMQPGFPGAPGMQPPQKRGIDPDHVPNVVAVVLQDQEKHAMPYNTSTRAAPPLTTSKVTIIDDGQCSPRIMRSTLYNVPTTDDILTNIKIPLALVVQPLSGPNADSDVIPVVDHGAEGPVRCRRCKAYLNPGVVFVDGGRRFQCNLCKGVSEVPEHYFCNLDHTGRRHDVSIRPELCLGSVEYNATKDYCARPPEPTGFLFVIDVSYASIQSGMLASACQAIRESLGLFPKGLDKDAPSPCKIGIITFDKSIHFYSLAPTLAQPQMMVVSDVTDIFVPLSTGLMASVHQSKDIVELLLERLPHMFANNRETEPCLGPALQAAVLALQSTGGRAVVFSTALQLTGPGALKKREDVALLGTDKEKTLFAPQDGFHKSIAADCIKSGVCLDLFTFPTSYIDVATLGAMATSTGGTIRRYPLFKSTHDGEKLVAEVKYIVSRPVGVEAMMRLRCSAGLRAVDFFGSFNMANTQDVELAGVDADTAISIRIKHDDKLPDNSDVHFQVALLYTTSYGVRRIRVHTLSLRTSSQYADIYRCADMDAYLALIPKMAVRDALSTPLAAVRDKMIISMCVGPLACYRKNCTSANTAAGQLILPEALKLLPAFSGSVVRNVAFRAGGDVGSDERMTALYLLQGMSPRAAVPFFYPRMVAVHDIMDGEEAATPILPPLVRLSYARLKDHGAYLLENGQELWLWLGKAVQAAWVQQVLGAASIQSVDVSMSSLPSLSNPLSARVRQVLDLLRAERTPFMRLHVAKQKDVTENAFVRFLVEDKFNDQSAYVDFLCHVHREIQVAQSK